MYATPEQFAAANKAGVDALFTIAHAHFAAFERLSALNFNTTKSVFEDSVNQAKALLSVWIQQLFVAGRVPESILTEAENISNQQEADTMLVDSIKKVKAQWRRQKARGQANCCG